MIDDIPITPRRALWLLVDPIHGLAALPGLTWRQKLRTKLIWESYDDHAMLKRFDKGMTRIGSWVDIATKAILRFFISGSADGLMDSYLAAWESAEATEWMRGWEQMTPEQSRTKRREWEESACAKARHKRWGIIRGKLLELPEG